MRYIQFKERKKSEIFFVLVGVLIILNLSAVPLRALTLTETVNLGWQQSPVIKAQEKLYQISLMDAWRKYLPSEPQIQFNAGDNASSIIYGASLTFPFPLKVMALGVLNDAQVNLQRAELTAKKYDVAKTVISAYLDCATQEAVIEFQKSSIEDLETLYESLRKRYEEGYSSLSDSIGAELQLKDARTALLGMEDHYNVAKENIRKILNLTNALTNDFTLDDDLTPEILKKLGEDTADHLRAEASYKLATSSSNTFFWQQFPDLNLSVNYNTYPYLPASPSGNPHAWSFSLGVALPILYPIQEGVESERMKNQNIIDQKTAEAQLIQAEMDEKDGALEYARSIKLLNELRKEEIPLVETLVGTTLTDYKTGKVGFAELMQSRKSLIDIKTREIQLRASTILSHLRSLGEETKHES